MSLRIIYGKASSGKTKMIMEEIRAAVEKKQGGIILLVPEQYSHECERELAAVCGPQLSLYAEVLSFTGLSRRIAAETGGVSTDYLDDAGKLLSMSLAAENCRGKLSYYGSTIGRSEIRNSLVKTSDELKMRCIKPEALAEAAEKTKGALSRKLGDLSTIISAYEAVVSNGKADPADRLANLAEAVKESSIGPGTSVYADGFIDFTAAEMKVLQSILDKDAQLTVCFNLDSLKGGSEVFSLSRLSARQLADYAGEYTETELPQEKPSFADELFTYSENVEKPGIDAEIYRCANPTEECTFAAFKVLELLRAGYRRRDIAIAVRGFEDYRDTLESTFESYKIPLFTAKKSAISSKSAAALINYAYSIILHGWNPDDLLGYLGTGLTGLSFEERDILANYIFAWQIDARLWLVNEKWHQHPDGYGAKYDENTEKRLERINALRERIAEPLKKLAAASSQAVSVAEQAAALAQFLKEIGLPKTLEARSLKLQQRGDEAGANEYSQLWDTVVLAVEQADSVLGICRMDTEEFSRLFSIMLSKYSVGTIPATLDSVSAGDFDRMRRRHIKHLIVLGAGADRLPAPAGGAKLFTADEIEEIDSLDIPGLRLSEHEDAELWREFSLIYNCISLPSEKLIISYTDSENGAAFLVDKAKAAFGTDIQTFEAETARNARLNVAKSSNPAGFEKIEKALSNGRGRLGEHGVKAIYGEAPKTGASRADTFYSCKYRYFCQYGLNAKPAKHNDFSAPEIGTYTHYVLENVVKAVEEGAGFEKADDELLLKLTDGFTARYIKEELEDFKEKNDRFKWLFNRIAANTRQVVLDTAGELRRSSFRPAGFEIKLDSGRADRIDAWENDGKKYVRIVDYKSGSKEFSLSDIFYGRSMQLLMYLNALTSAEESCAAAGAMYMPAKNKYLSFNHNPGDDEIEKDRAKENKITGIMLDENGIPDAWNSSETKVTKVSPRQYELLKKHIDKKITSMSDEILSGNIEADPFFKSESENACTFCDYKDCCGFKDGENGETCSSAASMKSEDIWKLLEEEAGSNG